MRKLDSPECVEAVAKALYYNGLTNDMPYWNELHEEERNVNRSYAQAAITAMLEQVQMTAQETTWKAEDACKYFARYTKISLDRRNGFMDGYEICCSDLGLIAEPKEKP